MFTKERLKSDFFFQNPFPMTLIWINYGRKSRQLKNKMAAIWNMLLRMKTC